jgi:hypothetical protein
VPGWIGKEDKQDQAWTLVESQNVFAIVSAPSLVSRSVTPTTAKSVVVSNS